MKPKEVLEAIRRAQPTIHVFGEGMTDHWHIGVSAGPSQEQVGVGKFLVKETRCQPGGAFSLNYSLRNLVRYDKVVSHVLSTGTVKHRFYDMEAKKIVFRWDCDSRVHASHDYLQAERSDCVIITDYGKGAVDMDAVYDFCADFGSGVIFSPHVNTLRRLRKDQPLPDVLWVLNGQEAGILGHRITEISAIVTLGNIGAMHVSGATGEKQEFGTRTVSEAIHRVACGDVFLAGLATATFAGQGMENSIGFGNACAWLAMQRELPGTRYIYQSDPDRLPEEFP